MKIIGVQVLYDSGNWRQVTNEVKVIHPKSKLNIKQLIVQLNVIYNLL